MAGQPKRRAPQLARTDFESMTHEQLAAMLDSATSEGAAQLATKLSKAASTITKIGDDLMTYTKGLEWQGEAGDAFRDWGGQTASATLRLGQYAEVASRWMATVAQAVAEAKAAMPDTSETTRAEEDLAEAKKTMAAAQQRMGSPTSTGTRVSVMRWSPRHSVTPTTMPLRRSYVRTTARR
ncbi:hypothetical protein ACIBAI_20305 [Streptomyces sp. NPDC051041]|uniref:hypothetical protein n=1 Tax=Streptomyces sp. NPDC051041 TaxID=3365640 RepID=UPI0037BADB5D